MQSSAVDVEGVDLEGVDVDVEGVDRYLPRAGGEAATAC